MTESARTLRDARGVACELARPAERVVSLVPSWTETLHALGAGARRVGVTEYCVHPDFARTAACVVGGTKTPDLARIRALAPEIVIANREENRRLDIERLEASGVRAFVTDARSVAAAALEIEQLGALVGAAPRARELAQTIRAALLRRPAEPPLCGVALIWKDPFMALGGDCFAHDLLVQCGVVNPFAGRGRRYPRIERGELAAAAPELILLPTEPYAFAEPDRRELLQLDCPAARNARIHIVEGELLTWYGPRIPRALATFRELIERARSGSAQ
jgi:ABC-type Fe3+-hydroxamate transport system substrate-binding protein